MKNPILKTNPDKLFELSINDKFDYLKQKIYPHIETSRTGRLLINIKYCRLAAKLLGGDYDKLSDSEKNHFKSELVFENLNPYVTFNEVFKH